MRRAEFGVADGYAYRFESVMYADFSKIEELVVTLTMKDGFVITATGTYAIEAAQRLRPSVIEGKRMRFARHAWALHNLIGHPLMQLFAFFKRYDKALAIHEATVPKCKGPK